MTNALLIAITAQFIPIETYRFEYRPENLMGIQGYVNWSLNPFYIDALLDGEAFPAVSAQQLSLFNNDGDSLNEGDGRPYMSPNGGDNSSNLLYLPYINFTCLLENDVSLSYVENGNTRARFFTVNVTIEGNVMPNYMTFSRDSWRNFYRNRNYTDLLYTLSTGNDFDDLSPGAQSFNVCFNQLSTQCR